jgi:hypothetical protein
MANIFIVLFYLGCAKPLFTGVGGSLYISKHRNARRQNERRGHMNFYNKERRFI